MEVVIEVERWLVPYQENIQYESCHARTSNCALTCVKLAGLNVVC